jgi:hypothetical protein
MWRMTAEELRDHCLALLGSEAEFPFGPESLPLAVAPG